MIETENTSRYKSKQFAIEVVETYKYLVETQKEFVLSKQFLRSGTSIGANLAESECAISENDFLNKLYVALKECNETLYWLELLVETGYLKREQYEGLAAHCSEIKRMLSAATKTITERKTKD